MRMARCRSSSVQCHEFIAQVFPPPSDTPGAPLITSATGLVPERQFPKIYSLLESSYYTTAKHRKVSQLRSRVDRASL